MDSNFPVRVHLPRVTSPSIVKRQLMYSINGAPAQTIHCPRIQPEVGIEVPQGATVLLNLVDLDQGNGQVSNTTYSFVSGTYPAIVGPNALFVQVDPKVQLPDPADEEPEE